MNNLLQDMLSDFTIFTKENFDTFISRYQHKANSIEANLLLANTTNYVSNIDTNMIAVGSNDDVWSASINHKEYNNAIVCSPFTTYVKYPFDLIGQFDKTWIKSLLICHTLIMNAICKLTKINQVLQVNNNLNSLLKHPNYFIHNLPKLTQFLTEHYQKHAILFFRVNELLDKDLIPKLLENDYIIFPDRIAHLFFPEQNYMKRSHTKRDLSLLRKTPYQIVQHHELTDEDAKHLSKLYRMLFIDKYSKFNPAYTAEYFSHSIKNNWHHYTALRHPNGQIDAFISWFCRDNIMICGPLGYDTTVPQKIGLYRILIALCLKHANENQYIFNMGAGSDEFKSNRGSTKAMEYTAVYFKHLPFYRHLPWQLLKWACTNMIPRVFNI